MSYVTTGLTSTITGQGNTAVLASDTGSADYPYQAALACTGLSYGGHSDWYLPAESEMWTMGGYSGAIANLNAGFYWTSSDYSNYQAWVASFNYGAPGAWGKTLPSMYAVCAPASATS